VLVVQSTQLLLEVRRRPLIFEKWNKRALKSFDRCAKPRHGLLQSVSLSHRDFGPLTAPATPPRAREAAVSAPSDGQLHDSVVTILPMVNKSMILQCDLASGFCIYRHCGGSWVGGETPLMPHQRARKAGREIDV
jgi:hypothetical protein